MTDRIRIVDPDPAIERILSDLDAKVNRTIVGLDGEPLLEPVVDDRLVTYSKDGESVSIDPIELIVRAARMQRDGMSLDAISAELDLKNVSHATLQRALDVGHEWLKQGIEDGSQPEESQTVLGYRVVGPEESVAPTRSDLEDALDMGRALSESWRKG